MTTNPISKYWLGRKVNITDFAGVYRVVMINTSSEVIRLQLVSENHIHNVSYTFSKFEEQLHLHGIIEVERGGTTPETGHPMKVPTNSAESKNSWGNAGDRNPLTHELKTWPEYFDAVARGIKTFEIRKNDRDFRVGDTLVLREYDPKNDEYSGSSLKAEVAHLVFGGRFGLAENHCAMAMWVDKRSITRGSQSFPVEVESSATQETGYPINIPTDSGGKISDQVAAFFDASGAAMLEMKTNGDILVRGELAENNQQVVEAMKDFLAGQGLFSTSMNESSSPAFSCEGPADTDRTGEKQ